MIRQRAEPLSLKTIGLVVQLQSTKSETFRKFSFQLKPFNDLTVGSERLYLVNGLIPRIGTTVIWGKPKSGKTFVVYDLTMHVALGWDYRGRRVHSGPVVYFAFEGAYGLRARAAAFRKVFLKEDNHREFPFYLVDANGQLERDQAAIIADIRAQLSDPPVCVVFDTLNRSLGGDENSGMAMTGYVNAAGAISAAFGCAVIVVHHCGHDDSRMRGFSGLGGNVDCQIGITRDPQSGVIVFTVVEAKDMPSGGMVASKLNPITVGIDVDGDSINSCVVIPSELPATRKGAKKLNAKQELVIRALTTLASGSQGKALPIDWGLPAGLVGVPVDALRDYLVSTGVLDAQKNAGKRFWDLRDQLKVKRMINERDGLVWRTDADTRGAG
jgi:hypothetical protein